MAWARRCWARARGWNADALILMIALGVGLGSALLGAGKRLER
ncbi:MAG: hypothetical protein RR379_11440 [Clostridia bacterium]